MTAGLRACQYAFVLELRVSGGLHAHGIFILDENDVKLIKSGLRKAGGKFPALAAARLLSVSDCGTLRCMLLLDRVPGSNRLLVWSQFNDSPSFRLLISTSAIYKN